MGFLSPFESETPGVMAARGLSYDAPQDTNARLIYVSTLPFASTGPKASSANSKFILRAAIYSHQCLQGLRSENSKGISIGPGTIVVALPRREAQ